MKRSYNSFVLKVNGEVVMKMIKEDADLFYSIWLQLLEYVNKKYKVIKSLKNIPSSKVFDTLEVAEIADVLYNHIIVIDEYIEKNADLTNEEKAILKGWKNFERQQFVIERHLKKESVFISIKDSKVYFVTGIVSSIEEMYSVCIQQLRAIISSVYILQMKHISRVI